MASPVSSSTIMPTAPCEKIDDTVNVSQKRQLLDAVDAQPAKLPRIISGVEDVQLQPAIDELKEELRLSAVLVSELQQIMNGAHENDRCTRIRLGEKLIEQRDAIIKQRDADIKQKNAIIEQKYKAMIEQYNADLAILEPSHGLIEFGTLFTEQKNADDDIEQKNADDDIEQKLADEESAAFAAFQ